MRTVFVNPRRKTVRRKRRNQTTPITRTKTNNHRLEVRNAFLKGKEKGMQLVANPRKRKARRKKRSRRRNAGIVPFVAASNPAHYVNPLILNNPRRRRPRRRNPTMTIEKTARSLMVYGGGSLIGASGNILGLNKIDDMWFRNGARIAAAVTAGIMMRGELGAATAGSVLYPVWQEIFLRVLQPTEADLEDDLDTLAADLEDALDEYYEDDDDDDDEDDDDDDEYWD